MIMLIWAQLIRTFNYEVNSPLTTVAWLSNGLNGLRLKENCDSIDVPKNSFIYKSNK